MKKRSAIYCGILFFLLATQFAFAEERAVEVRSRIAQQAGSTKRVALTLDACSGRFDDRLIQFLIRNRIPATIFATKRWIEKNPYGLSVIRANLDLFDVENHGENHVPAVIGLGRKIFGIPGARDLSHLRREVTEGARAIERGVGIRPRWYRGATGFYDPEAIDEIRKLGYGVAGFSVNADSGATLEESAVRLRMQEVRDGDVIIAHMNRPGSASARGLETAIVRLQKEGFEFVRFDRINLTELPTGEVPAPQNNGRDRLVAFLP